ncbi:hypothetical protein FB45DRAFT_991249 [Roridomyces roridus]|uniref:Biotrophy-associated secreted protein 2 n=1 Tax=Roridomyces roridus TaxID=1738132 RepID=A0AAD7FJA3_9AGAR|nr:hypothetical protein FB45DRAFT_991249 [Roridomyces roridus]
MKFSITVTLTTCSLLLLTHAHELPSRYALQRRGSQFVTGPCTRDSDCQQGCCAFTTGKCAGPGIAQTRDGGCGFGNAKPNCDVAAALNLGLCASGAVNGDLTDPNVQKAAEFVAKLDGFAFTPAKSETTMTEAHHSPSASAASPTKTKTSSPAPTSPSSQSSKLFVTAACTADSQCQQGCCAFNTGKCAGPGIAQTRDGGCGFGDAKPNCNVAAALKLGLCADGASQDGVENADVQSAAEFTAKLDGFEFTPAGRR